MKIKELLDYTEQLLNIARFKDYCPNGLQVEGRTEVNKIVSGVTASMALLQAAQAAGADMVLVHHGYFWRGEDATITGIKQRRIQFLLQHGLNLVAYHLPLDAHPTLGNNAQLADKLGFSLTDNVGENGLLALGQTRKNETLQILGEKFALICARKPLIFGELARPLHRVAWCTGAAQHMMELAVTHQVDVFVTGEVSEQTYHLAQESGVAFIAAGHHATERYGVQALGNHLAEKFALEHQFIDIENPV